MTIPNSAAPFIYAEDKDTSVALVLQCENVERPARGVTCVTVYASASDLG